MNEPKRRGRPPKASAHEQVTTAMDVIPRSHGEDAARYLEGHAVQAYARRIWSGQSVSLSRHERMGRVRAALEAQGMSMEGVELP